MIRKCHALLLFYQNRAQPRSLAAVTTAAQCFQLIVCLYRVFAGIILGYVAVLARLEAAITRVSV